jgi:hypothetical protein
MTLQTEGPWRAEVVVYDGHRWVGNALRFSSEAEALAYGFQLRGSWMLVDKVRVVRDTTPHNEPYIEGSEARHYQDLKETA